MEEKRIRRSIIFPASLYEKAKKQADREFRQISGLVVVAVEKYLEEKERGKKQNRAAVVYMYIYCFILYVYKHVYIIVRYQYILFQIGSIYCYVSLVLITLYIVIAG